MALISDRDKEFFAPLWRRVALLLVLLGWMGFEYIWGDEMWAWLAVGITALSVWIFFISFKPPEAASAKDDQPAAPDPDDEG